MMKKIFLAIIVSLIFLAPVKATHFMGGEITWECIKSGPTQGMYIFRLKLYRDCNGSTIVGAQTLTVYNHPSVFSIALNLIQQNDISPDCDALNSPPPPAGITYPIDCANGSSANPIQGAVEEHIFESNPVNLPGIPPAGGWHFCWDGFARNNAITNLTSPGSLGMTLRAIMYPYTIAGVPQNTSPCFDSSPQFEENPKTIICTGYPFSYSHNASDPELDSLVYEWANILDDGVYNPAAPPVIPLSAPYAFNSPLPSNLSVPPFPYLNPQTGEISYYTDMNGNFVTCVKVSAWKCQQLVAEVYREIQVILIYCNPLTIGPPAIPNTPPIVQAPFTDPVTLLPSYDTVVFAGDVVSFNIEGVDSNFYSNGAPQDIKLSASGGQFSSNFINDTLCANPPCATFDNGSGLIPPFSSPTVVSGVFYWQTSCYHIASNAGCNTTSNLYTFAIKLEDDFCPAPAITFATITIEVIQVPSSVPPDVNCATVDNNGDVLLTWNHLPGANLSTAYHVYSATNPLGPFSLVDSMYYPIDNFFHQGVNANLTPMFYYMTTSSSCAGMSPSFPP